MPKRRRPSKVHKRLVKGWNKQFDQQLKDNVFNGPVITRQATPEELARMRARVAAKRRLPST